MIGLAKKSDKSVVSEIVLECVGINFCISVFKVLRKSRCGIYFVNEFVKSFFSDGLSNRMF